MVSVQGEINRVTEQVCAAMVGGHYLKSRSHTAPHAQMADAAGQTGESGMNTDGSIGLDQNAEGDSQASPHASEGIVGAALPV